MKSSQATDLNGETERFRNLSLLDERNNVRLDKGVRKGRKGGVILIEALSQPRKPEKQANKKKSEAKTSSRKDNPCVGTDNAMEGDVEMKQSSHVATGKTKKAHISQDRENNRDKGSTKPDSKSSGEKAICAQRNETNQNLSENSFGANSHKNGKGPRIKVRSSSASSDPSKSNEVRNNLKLLFTSKNKTIPKVKSAENTSQKGSDDNDRSSKKKKMVSPLEGLYPAERLQYGVRLGQYSVEDLMGRPGSHEDVDDNNTDLGGRRNSDFLNETTKLDRIYKSLTVESNKDEKSGEAKRKEKSKTNEKNKTRNVKKGSTRPKKLTTENANKETVNGESKGAVMSPKQTVSEDRNENLITEENVACSKKTIKVMSIKNLMTTAVQKSWNLVKHKGKIGEIRPDRERETASNSLSSASKKKNNNDRKMSGRSKSEKAQNRTRTNSNTDQVPEPESVNAHNQTLTTSLNVEVNNNSPQPLTSQQETIADYYDWMNPNNTNDGNMEENRETLTSVMNSDDDSINSIRVTETGCEDSISTVEVDYSSAITMNLRICEPTELVENVNNDQVYSAFNEGAGTLFGDENDQRFDGEEGKLFGNENRSANYEDTGNVFREEDGPKLFAEGQNLFKKEDGPKLSEETGDLFKNEDGPKLFVGPDLFEVEDGPKIRTVTGNAVEEGFGLEFYEGAGNLNENNNDEEILRPNGEEEPRPAENPDGTQVNAANEKKKRGRKKKPGPVKKKGVVRKAETNNRVPRKRTAKPKLPRRSYQTRCRMVAEINFGNAIDLLEEIEEQIEQVVNNTNEEDGEGKPKQVSKVELRQLREGLYTVFQKKPNEPKSRSPSPNAQTNSNSSDLQSRKRPGDPEGDNQDSDVERKRARTSSHEAENLNSESQESNNEKNSAEADCSHSERGEDKPANEEASTTIRDLNSESQESNNEQNSAEADCSHSEKDKEEPATEETSATARYLNSESQESNNEQKSAEADCSHSERGEEEPATEETSTTTRDLNSESQKSNNEQNSAEADSSHSERDEEESATEETSTTARSVNENQNSYVEERRGYKTPYNLRTIAKMTYYIGAYQTRYNLRKITYRKRARKIPYNLRSLQNGLRKSYTIKRSTKTKRDTARKSGWDDEDSDDEQSRAGTYSEPESEDRNSDTEQERSATEYENEDQDSDAEPERVATEPEKEDEDSDAEPERVATEYENEDEDSDAEPERVATEPEKEDEDSDAEPERVATEPEKEDEDSDAEPERVATEPEKEDEDSDAEERTTETVRRALNVGTTSDIGKKSARNKAGKKMTGPHKTGRVSSVEDANINISPNLNPKVVLDKLNLKTFDRDEIMLLAHDMQYRQKNGMQSEQQAKGHKRSQHKKQKNEMQSEQQEKGHKRSQQKKLGGGTDWGHRPGPKQGGVPKGKQNKVENGKEDQDEEQTKEAGSAKRINSYLERNVRKSKRLKSRGTSRGYVCKKITDSRFRVFLPPNFTTGQRKRKSSDDEEMREQHLNNKKKKVPVRNETATDSESIQWLKSYSLLNYFFRKSQKIYRCLLCPKVTGSITSHYKLIHRESEVLISRLSRKEASDAIEDAIAEGIAHEVENNSTQARPQSCVYTCRMCDIHQMTRLRDFFAHVTTHTGEYNLTYPTGLSTSPSNHSELTKENTLNSVEYEPLHGFICSRCNYVQVFRKNVEEHVERKHKDDRNISIIKINLSSKESSRQTNDFEQNRSTTSEGHILPERQQQNEDDGTEIEYYEAEVPSRRTETENYSEEVEYYEAEKPSGRAETENSSAEIEYYEAEVPSRRTETENYSEEVEYYEAEKPSGRTETENYSEEIEYYEAEKPSGRAETENSSEEVEYYEAEKPSGRAETENSSAEVEYYEAEVPNRRTETENSSAEVEYHEAGVQNGKRVEEESYSPKSPSPEPNGETFGLEMNKKRAEHNDNPELINIADLPNSPPLVELDVDEDPKEDDTVDIKIELEIGPFERRKWIVGLLKAQILDDSDFLYDCLVKTCMFTTRVYSNFESHVRIMHSNTLWRGNCDACNYKASPGETLTMLNALEHLTSHSRGRRSRGMGLMKDNSLPGSEIDSPEQRPVEEDSNNNTTQNHKASCYYAHECGSELCRHCTRGFCDERCFVIRQPPHGVKTYFCNFCTFKSALKKSMAKHVFSKHSTMMENALLEEKVTPDSDHLSSASNAVDSYQNPFDLYPNPNQDHSALQEFTNPNQAISPPHDIALNLIQDLSIQHDMPHDLSIRARPSINFSEPIISQAINSYSDKEPLDLSQDHYKRR